MTAIATSRSRTRFSRFKYHDRWLLIRKSITLQEMMGNGRSSVSRSNNYNICLRRQLFSAAMAIERMKTDYDSVSFESNDFIEGIEVET